MKLHLSAFAASALTLALMTAGATAQDRTFNPTALDYMSSATSWSGLYVGVHGGVIDSGRIPNPLGNTKAFEGGLQVGTRAQFGNFVVGAEASGTYSSGLVHQPNGSAQLKQNWSVSAKAIAGVAFDDILIYGAVGYGVARLEPGGSVTSGAVNVGGMLFGAGAEYALTDNLSLRLDYTQTRFGGVKATSGGTAQSYDLVNHSIRTGLNFRF